MTLDSLGLFVIVGLTIGFMPPALAGYAALVLGWFVYVQNRRQQSDIKRLAGTFTALVILLKDGADE